MPASTKATFPFEPLERRVACALRLDGLEVNNRTIAERLGCSMSAVLQYRRGHPLQYFLADLFAVRIGFHPASVWGDYWWEAVEHDTEQYLQRVRAKNQRKRSVAA